MRFITDRKRATGLGSSGTGTEHHWKMMVSSMLLVLAVPAFVIVFLLGYGGSYEEVLAFFGRPIPALITGLSLFVIINHVKHEAHEAIEDYMHGTAEKLALVASSAFAYTLLAAALFSIVKIAL